MLLSIVALNHQTCISRKRHTRGALRVVLEPKKHYKRGKFEYNPLETVVQNLLRSNLLKCLDTYWDILKVDGIFATQSRQVFTWTLEGNSEQVHRLYHHLILRHLDVEDDLH